MRSADDMTLWDVHIKNEAGRDDNVRVAADTEWEAERIGFRESDAVDVIGAYLVTGEVSRPVEQAPAAAGNWWEAPRYDAFRVGPYTDADAACAASCAVAAGDAGGRAGDAGDAGDLAGDRAGDTDGDA
jgi:hypothetical protein